MSVNAFRLATNQTKDPFMKFADFVKTEAIKSELESSEKEGVIRELVQSRVLALIHI